MDDPSRSWSSDDDDRPPARSERPAVVEVHDADGALSTDDLLWLREHAARAAASLGAPGEVRVRVVRDEEMAEAHLRFAGVPGTTDVLTFDLAGDARTLDVDVLVCADEARRQAARLAHDTRRELLLYIVHAMLHCLGHDDHDDDDYQRMHDTEDRLLEQLGVGITFARDQEGSAS